MMTNDVDDLRLEGLAALAALTPDPKRADRTRRRCLAHLARQRRRQERGRGRVARPVLRPLALGTFCVFCVFYLGALVATTLRLEDQLR